MTIKECREYLNELNNKGIKPGLDAIRALLDALGSPEKDLKIIHIAGTNGKGSVGCYIRNILKAAGYKTGHYSSPAVFEEREIININGRNISERDYIALVEEIKATGLEFTRFELETAMAFLYFKKKACDFAVIECGMGGLMDATNAVADKELCVFTQIGMDHSDFLGKTVAEIARNKAGIIRFAGSAAKAGVGSETSAGGKTSASSKTSAGGSAEKNVRIVYIKSGVESDAVIEEAAAAAGCGCVAVNGKRIVDITYKGVNSNDLPGVVFDYKNYVDISIRMAGTFQPLNAACAIESAVALRNLGWKISDKAIMNGLHNAHLPGRFEVIATDPVFVIDGAHNEPASKQLAKSIATYFPDKRLIFIIGVLKDKEYDKVVRNTCELAWQVITVTSPNRTRALPAYELAKTVYEVNPNVTAADSIPEAVETALMMASRDDVIVSFGSLSYLGEVRAALANRR